MRRTVSLWNSDFRSSQYKTDIKNCRCNRVKEHLFFDFLFLLKIITDPCSSSPCLHGNCSRTDIVEDMVPSYICECAKGYKGERCDQSFSNLLAAKSELANPSTPEPETPATSATSATTQPIPIASTTTPPPTLQPWQPKPRQRLQVVPWETSRVRQAV